MTPAPSSVNMARALDVTQHNREAVAWPDTGWGRCAPGHLCQLCAAVALALDAARRDGAREVLEQLGKGREFSHLTYNGGHTGEKCEAFHHGMETVYNIIDSETRAAALETEAPHEDHD